MKKPKHVICLLLCLVMVLSLAACGKEAAEEPTASPADAYLAMAKELMAQGKYDSALDVLNQAKESITDGRLDALIDEIEDIRPTFLDLEFRINTDHLISSGVHVHNVTAEVLDKTVRYTIDYTAPEGMYLQIEGTDHRRCWDYLTPGGEDQFVFELDKKVARDHFRSLTVLFRYSSDDYARLNITASWDEDIKTTLVRIPVTNSESNDCRVNLATVRAVSKDLLHFHVEVTTPLDQQYIAGLSFMESGEDMFFSVGTAPGDDALSFMMTREEMENIDSIYVRLFPADDWDGALVAKLPSSDYTLPKAPNLDEDLQTVIDNTGNTVFPVENEKGHKLTVDSVVVQPSPAGNLYTLTGDFSETTSNTAYCNIGYLAYTVTAKMNGSDQMQFFVPAEYLVKSNGMTIECWGQSKLVANVPMTCDFTPAAVTVLHPEKTTYPNPEETVPDGPVNHLYWDFGNYLTSSTVEIFGITQSTLENGNSLYVLDYQASPGMIVTAFDPPNGDQYVFSRLQETSGYRETFAFEVEKSMMDKLENITVSFWSEYDNDNFFVAPILYQYRATVTDGNPVGEPQVLNVSSDSKVQVHNLTAQQLDNGYVRYTMEYTTTEGRYISFFNQPNSDRFLYLLDNPVTTGEKGTYVIDIPQVDNNAVNEITMKFYHLPNQDQVFAWFAPADFTK